MKILMNKTFEYISKQHVIYSLSVPNDLFTIQTLTVKTTETNRVVDVREVNY